MKYLHSSTGALSRIGKTFTATSSGNHYASHQNKGMLIHHSLIASAELILYLSQKQNYFLTLLLHLPGTNTNLSCIQRAVIGVMQDE